MKDNLDNAMKDNLDKVLDRVKSRIGIIQCNDVNGNIITLGDIIERCKDLDRVLVSCNYPSDFELLRDSFKESINKFSESEYKDFLNLGITIEILVTAISQTYYVDFDKENQVEPIYLLICIPDEFSCKADDCKVDEKSEDEIEAEKTINLYDWVDSLPTMVTKSERFCGASKYRWVRMTAENWGKDRVKDIMDGGNYPFMMISDAIKKLQAIMDKYGDLPISYRNTEYGSAEYPSDIHLNIDNYVFDDYPRKEDGILDMNADNQENYTYDIISAIFDA